MKIPNVNLKPEIHRKLKIYAAKNGLKMGSVVDEAINSYIDFKEGKKSKQSSFATTEKKL